MSLPGAFKAQKKDGTVYYRASVTYKNKHISLGSFAAENDASSAYCEAQKIVSDTGSIYNIDSYHEHCRLLSFDKYISLLNFRDNNFYIKNTYLHG